MLQAVAFDPVSCLDTEVDGVLDDILAYAHEANVRAIVQIGQVALVVAPSEKPVDVSTRYRTRLCQINEEKILYERRQGERRKIQFEDVLERRHGDRRHE